VVNAGNSVSLLLGNGDGTFQNPTTYSTVPYSSFILSADLNSDSKFDLAVTNTNDKSVSVLLGNGDGTFQNRITYAVDTYPTSIAPGAFRNDAKLDLAVTDTLDNNVVILLNSCS
jgi:hypothetical protein